MLHVQRSSRDLRDDLKISDSDTEEDGRKIPILPAASKLPVEK